MNNARLYALVIGVIVGVVLFSNGTPNRYSAVFLFLAFVNTIIASWIVRKNKNNFSQNFQKHFVLAALIVTCVFGIIIGAARVTFWQKNNHSGSLETLVNKKVSLTGVVSVEPQVSDTSTKIILKTFVRSSQNFSTTTQNVLVTADRYSTVSYGDEIKIFGKLMKPKPIEGADFDYEKYLARQGIFYTMTFPSITIVSHNKENIVRELLIKTKNIFLNKINQQFLSPNCGLLAGLLISGRSSLSKSDQETFTKAGLIHIVALSGFNVTIIAQGLMMLLSFLPKRLRLIIGAVGIVGFVTMAGFGSTIVRAGIMALLVILSALFYRTYDVGRALFMAVLFMILWNPMVVYDVSFQLSCIATFVVIFVVPLAVEKNFKYLKFLPEKFLIRETMLSTAIIELYLLPILLSTSGQISLVTVITNLLVLPILPIVMGFGFVATVLGFISWFLALPFVAISNLMLGYIMFITNLFSNIPFGVFNFKISTWQIILMYTLLLVWLWRLQCNKNKTESAAQNDAALSVPTLNSPLTSANLERLDNFFQSHSNSNSQKKR